MFEVFQSQLARLNVDEDVNFKRNCSTPGGGRGGGEDSCMIMKQTSLSSKSHLVLLFRKLYHVFS